MNQIKPTEISGNVFHRIGTQWMLITAEHNGKANTMTASWGGLGEMWGHHTAAIVIRPQRYTREFVDQGGAFTLSFLPETYRGVYNLLGTKSGRDGDKIAEAKLTLQDIGGLPAFAEAELTLCCKVLYRQDMRMEHFTDNSIPKQFYPDDDFHRLYIGEILSAWTA